MTTNTAKIEMITEEVDELPKDYLTNLKEGEGFERISDGATGFKYKLTRQKPTINADDKYSLWQQLGTLFGITPKTKVPEQDSQSGESTNNNEEPDMAKLTEADRPKLIKELTTNCDCWNAKDDATTLKALPLEKLGQLVNHAKEHAADRELADSISEGITDTAGAKLSFNAETKTWEAQKPEKKPAKAVINKDESDDDDEEPVSRLTPEQEETLNWAKKEQNKKRTSIITKLVANVHPDKKADKVKKLQKKTLNELEELYEELLDLSANAGPDDDEDDDGEEEYQPQGRRRKPGRYAGAGRVANSDDDEGDLTDNLLIPPTLNFGGDSAGDLRKRLEASRSN